MPTKTLARRVVGGLAVLLGGASLLLFGAFLVVGPVVRVRLGWGNGAVLGWDAGLSLLFFAQHSVMVRSGFKRRLERWIGRGFHGAVYAIGSGLALGAAMVLWQTSTVGLVHATGPGRWLLRGVAAAAIAGLVGAVRALREFDLFGVRPLSVAPDEPTRSPGPLVIRGPYRWMRHPIYAFSIVLIWTMPDVTADRLLFNVLWTAWIGVGAWWEERDLVAQFGEAYREYQRRVPMLGIGRKGGR